MANNFFKFKKFTVYQDQCVMKVCTDSCIFGAYTPVTNQKRILDIGTGTGLLSLMLAQRTEAKIDAVEIDFEAYQQALQNVQNTPWKHRIQVYHQSIQTFQEQFEKPVYDLILTNPPFYENYLKSPSTDKNIALHAESLSFDELLEAIKTLLKPDGYWAVLLPEYESKRLENKAHLFGYQVFNQLLIKNQEDEQAFRIINLYSSQKQAPAPRSKTIHIRNSSGEYSEAFKNLLKDYYLIF